MEDKDVKILTEEDLKEVTGGVGAPGSGWQDNSKCPFCSGKYMGGTTMMFSANVRLPGGRLQAGQAVRCVQCQRAWLYGIFPQGSQVQYQFIAVNVDGTYSLVW